MENNTEISFQEIIKEVLGQKLAGFLIFFVTLSAGVIYALLIDEDKWKGHIDIKTLSSTDYVSYEELNNFSEIFEIDKVLMRQLLIEEIVDRSEVREVLAEIRGISKESFSSNAEYNVFLTELSYNFSISYLTKQDYDAAGLTLDMENQDVYRLTFVTNTPSEISKVFNYVLRDANEKVRNYFNGTFASSTDSYNNKLKHEIQDIENIINSLHNINQSKLQQKIEYLSTQAEIAKSLNIMDNTLFAQTLEDNSAIKLESPYYLRGYEAISKEIKLLNENSNKKGFVPEIYDFEQELELLNSDLTLQRINDAFLKTSINDPNMFKSAIYDISEIRLKKIDRSSIEIMFITSLISLFLYISYIFLRIVLRSR